MNDPHFVTQKGFVPFLSRWLAITWLGYLAFGGLFFIISSWRTASEYFSLTELVVPTLASTLRVLTISLFLAWPGLLLGSLFPSIRVRPHGIEYRYLFLRDVICWNEITMVTKVKAPILCLAIVFDRPITSLIRRLWIPVLHGVIARVWKPVVLLAADSDYQSEVVRAIRLQTTSEVGQVEVSGAKT